MLAREGKGLTVPQLAEKLKISVSALYKIEEQARAITIEKALLVCDALNITPNDLFGYKADLPKHFSGQRIAFMALTMYNLPENCQEKICFEVVKLAGFYRDFIQAEKKPVLD